MKYFLILIVFLSFSITAFTQSDSLGFTNKAEAENKTMNGLKEGKWVEYFDEYADIINDTNAPYYKLTIYKAGKLCGKYREYYKSGKLMGEGFYIKDVPNGTFKEYNENGKLMSETTYINGVGGKTKRYDENGNEIK